MVRRRALRLATVTVVAVVLLPLVGTAGNAAPKCRGTKCSPDTTAPLVSIVTPTAGHLVAGSVSVTGASSDNVAVANVSVSVDGGPWSPVSGTSSWSWAWSTTTIPNGNHVVAARAIDAAGNVATTDVAVVVSNPTAEPPPPADTTAPALAITTPAAGSSVSGSVVVSGSAFDNTAVAMVEVNVDGGAWHPATGTGSWSWTWSTTSITDGSHVLSVRVKDHAGNAATSTRSVTVANQTAPPSVWTSPEGVQIDIRTSSGGWTAQRIHELLIASSRDLEMIGPRLKIVVQDTKPTLASIAASSVNGRYTSVSATIQLDARSTSSFSMRPDDILAHEYGHVWVNHYAYVKWQGDWSAYDARRWTSVDGTRTLATDTRTGTTYVWTPDEIAADDYRLLFASGRAVAQRNAHLNQQIPDPRSQPGLADWFLTVWAG